MRRTVMLTVLFIILAGCAQIDHVSVNNDETNKKNRGIRYYQSSPYLIVYSDGKGGVAANIEYLPDPNKKMSVTPTSFWSKFNTNLEFENGVLKTSKVVGDATAVPKAAVEAVKAAAAMFVAALRKSKKIEKFSVPAPLIYKIVVKGRDVKFVSGSGDTEINVTLLPQVPEEKPKNGGKS